MFQEYICPRKLFSSPRSPFPALTNLFSGEATEQTEGFHGAFKLTFEDSEEADNAFDKFLENGTIPDHGRGPWVIFVGRRRGVFTS